jgi:hypothetical protein
VCRDLPKNISLLPGPIGEQYPGGYNSIPEQVKKNIDKQEKENDLLQVGNKIGTVEPFLKNGFKKLEGFIQYDDDQKSVKEVADTDRQPAKKKTLCFGDPGKYAAAIVSFHPIRVPGYPFDKYGQHNDQNPAPAFHQVGK